MLTATVNKPQEGSPMNADSDRIIPSGSHDTTANVSTDGKTPKKHHQFGQYLPMGFDANAHASGRKWRVQADKARYLMGTVTRRQSNFRDDGIRQGGFIPLNGERLRQTMGRNYFETIRPLLASGQLERTDGYEKGVTSYGYRLGEMYIDDGFKLEPITDERLNLRIADAIERNKQEQRERMAPVHIALEKMQWGLSVDMVQAAELLDALPVRSNPYSMQNIIIDRIRRRDYAFTISEYGRVFNSISGLSGDVRPALRLNRQKMVGLDIRSSQPAGLSYLVSRVIAGSRLVGRDSDGRRSDSVGSSVHEHGMYMLCTFRSSPPPDGVYMICKLGDWEAALADHIAAKMPSAAKDVELDKDELQRFQDYVTATSDDVGLYALLADEAGKDIATVKRALLRDVIAMVGKYDSDVGGAFARLFPTLYEWIRAFNSNHHANLIRCLQWVESQIVLHRWVPRYIALTDEPCITLHDGIYTTPDGLPALQQAFDETAAEIDFPLQVKPA